MEDFIERLTRARIGETFNFYRDGEGAESRCGRLRTYLVARSGATLLLVGEAAGYRGARVSGIPFASERQLTGAGPAEATATVVRRVLAELGLEEETLCWNVVPTHPHLPGRPETNRRPTRAEVDASRRFLDELARTRRVVPVGRLAQAVLGSTDYIRHPSHGGAEAFRAGLLDLKRRRQLRRRNQLVLQATRAASPVPRGGRRRSDHAGRAAAAGPRAAHVR